MTAKSIDRRSLRSACATVATLLAVAGTASAQPAALELRIASESLPPGGVLQAKVEVTEPRPILTGGGSFDLGGFGEFLGLAAHSPNGDAAAAAVIRGSTARVAMVSSSGGLGLDPDYPILTMTVRAPASVPVGTRVPLTLAGGAVFLDPTGAPYPYSFRPGEATIAPGPSIANVSPGSALVPAGSVVTVDGLGFAPDAELRINEVSIAQTRFVSPTRLEAVLAQPATMHGRRVEVRNLGTNERTVYFAYQRTVPLGTSAHPLFRAVDPAFAQRFFTAAVIPFAAQTPASVPGLALQHIGAGPASAVLEMVAPGGATLGRAAVTLGANTRAVRSLAEIFGTTCASGCAVRVTASAPLQLMGLQGDLARDLAVPIPPMLDVSMQLTTALDAVSYRAGDPLTLSASFTPGLLPQAADVYVVLQAPVGQIQSLTPLGLVPGLAPLMRHVAPADPVTQELLRTVIPAGTAPGSYQWLSAMTSPGTLNLLTSIATTSFTITP
ncbi:MAG: hypothetical protein OEW19_06160 [Acidobacteriota bacterium]|nr:hypothetical protein [Acidobacteriota bacterium]